MTGDWEAAEERAAAGPDEDGDEDDALGEFEDMETGALAVTRTLTSSLAQSEKAVPQHSMQICTL